MKRLLFPLALLLASLSYAEGPIFRHSDSHVNQELDNVYQDIRGNTSAIAALEVDVSSNTTNINQATYDISTLLPFRRIVQVVSSTTTSSHSESSASYSDTNLSASITPRFSDSIIVVIVSQYVSINAPGAGTNIAGLRLLRGASTLLTTPALAQSGTTPALTETMVPLFFLDSPASTNALTYKTQIANVGAVATSVIANNNPASNSSTSSIILMELALSR